MDEPTDERKAYSAIQTVISAMLEFDKDTRARMLKTVATFFGVDDSMQPSGPQPATASGRVDPAPLFSEREDLSPKDFLFQKNPKTDVERAACLAFYLTHYRNIPHFKTTDISKLNTEAAQLKFSNTSNTVNNATQSGFLAPASRGTKQLSALGEKFVDLLPDRSAAKKVLSELRPRRRRRAASKESVQRTPNGKPTSDG